MIALVRSILAYLICFLAIISWFRLLRRSPNRAVIVFASYVIALFMLLAAIHAGFLLWAQGLPGRGERLFLQVVGRWANLHEPLPTSEVASVPDKVDFPLNRRGRSDHRRLNIVQLHHDKALELNVTLQTPSWFR